MHIVRAQRQNLCGPTDSPSRTNSRRLPYTTTNLVLALHDVRRNRAQRIGLGAVAGQGLERKVEQPAGLGAGTVEAHELRVGGLVGVLVLAGGLAELLGGGGHVQDVVGDLEGEPDGVSVDLHVLHVRVRGAGELGAALHAALEQRGGLVGVDPAEVVQAHALLALALEVHDLPAGEAQRPHAGRKVLDDVEGVLDGHAYLGKLLGGEEERLREHGVTGEDGDILAVHHVVRRLAAAQVVVVHGGQVVVDEAHRVDHLHAHASRQGLLDRGTEEFGGGDHEHGADALAAGHEGVLHGLADLIRVLLRRLHGSQQGLVHLGQALGHVALKVEGGGGRRAHAHGGARRREALQRRHEGRGHEANQSRRRHDSWARQRRREGGKGAAGSETNSAKSGYAS
mmetsp:Transcript_38678/g.121161  ORF Transcript_38678/g.121161 Transcript_38678/m.121161 type:complete len:397 (+) Transcript_38678:293-1483(+)